MIEVEGVYNGDTNGLTTFLCRDDRTGAAFEVTWECPSDRLHEFSASPLPTKVTIALDGERVVSVTPVPW